MATFSDEKGKTVLPKDDVKSPGKALPSEDVFSLGPALSADEVTSPGKALPDDDISSLGTALPTDDVTSLGTALPEDDVTSLGTALPEDDVTSLGTALPTDDDTSLEKALPADDVSSLGTALPTDDVTSLGTALPTDDVTSLGTALVTDDVTSLGTALPTDDVTSLGKTLPDDDDTSLGKALPADDVSSLGTALPTDDDISLEKALPTDDVTSLGTALLTDDVTSLGTALPADDVTSLGKVLPADDDTLQGTALPIDDGTSPGTVLPAHDVTSPRTYSPVDDVTSPGTTLPDDDIRKSTTASGLQLGSQDDEPTNQTCTVTPRDMQGGAELLNMAEVLRSQLQDSETSFVQANSQVVADSERSRCVQTDDLKEASDILQETGRVILCGFPGTGKTTGGHALLRRCREEGFKPYTLSKLEDWHAHIGPGRRSFVLIDAIMGEVRVNRQQYEEWRKILRNMLELTKAGDCRVVITLYPHVLHELQQLETDSQSPLLDSSAVVRLMTDDLDTEVKIELLDFHLKQLPLQPSQQQEVVERIVQADTSGPAFFWCCRYLVDHWQAVEDPATVFTSPAEANSVLLKQMCLHETHGDSFAAVLVLAMLGKGRFLHKKTGVKSDLRRLGFKEYCDDHLAEYEDILHGSVLSETDQGFSSRAWYDAAGLALGRSFRLPTLLEVCDVTFLVQHVHVTVTGGTQKALKILVGSGPFASLARKTKSVTEDCRSLTKRLCEELSKGHLPEVCQHTSLRCPEFLVEMTGYCQKGKYSAKQLVKVMDTVHSLPLLYWSTVHEQHVMTDWCISMLDLSTKADLKLLSPKVLLGLSLFSSSEHKNEAVTKPLFFQELFSAKSVQFSGDVVILPVQKVAMCEIERKASVRAMRSKAETSPRQLNYLCDPSLPIPSTLVRVEVSDDTVTVQVRDRGDWYLVLRMLADREVDETDRDGNTLLHIAADKGIHEAITLAVKSGASLTKTNDKGLTPYQLAQRRKEKDKIAINRNKMSHNLYSAVRNGNEVKAKVLLCYRSSVNDKDFFGITGLSVACDQGQGNIADLLIQLGADVNVKEKFITSNTPLYLACRNHQTQTVDLLIKHNAKINAKNYYGETALHCACRCVSPAAGTGITRLLLDAGADVNARDDEGRTPLHYACEKGATDIVTCLLQDGAQLYSVDDMERTPLHCACEKCAPDIVTCLIQHGANVNAVNDTKSTPLHYACAAGHIRVARQLIDEGADVNARDESQSTPLHRAAALGYAEISLCLIEHGAVVDAADINDTTPLHKACENGHTETVQCLLQHGANVNNVSELWGTPLEVTRKRALVTLLVQHGAVSREQATRTP